MVRSDVRAIPTLAALLLLAAAATVQAQVGQNQGLLNPNLAEQEELTVLPQLNEELAKTILSGRPFLTMTALDEVLAGKLTEETRQELYRKLWVPMNLNAATREEILLIPGTGPRMLREFLEYRPYKALEEFHREIGKYVDEQELARLEQYVFVPIDLNTASDEDILTIPGAGRRMLREFKEYRPYTDIRQFRREIGKYVDEKEVARLERYVMIGG